MLLSIYAWFRPAAAFAVLAALITLHHFKASSPAQLTSRPGHKQQKHNPHITLYTTPCRSLEQYTVASRSQIMDFRPSAGRQCTLTQHIRTAWSFQAQHAVNILVHSQNLSIRNLSCRQHAAVRHTVCTAWPCCAAHSRRQRQQHRQGEFVQ